MSESVILVSPLLIALYGLALVLTLIEKRLRTGSVLPWAAAILVMVTAGLSLVMGASLRETAAVIVLFIIVNLTGLKEGKG